MNLGEQAKRPIDKNLGEQAKRPIDKKSKPGGGDSLRRQPEGCVPGMARNKLGKRAKRPIDKKALPTKRIVASLVFVCLRLSMLLAGAGPLAWAIESSMGLEEAVAAALANDTELARTRLEQESAEHRVDSVSARYGPSLELEGRLLIFDDRQTLELLDPASLDLSTIPAPFDQMLGGVLAGVAKPVALRDLAVTELSLSLVQPLSGLFQVSRNEDLAQLAVEVSKSRQELRRRELSYSVTQCYLSLLAAQQMVEVAQGGVDAVQRHVEAAERFAEFGVASKADLLAARAELAARQQQLISVEAQVELLAAQLARLVDPENGGHILPLEQELAIPPAFPLELEEAQARAVNNREELALAELSEQAAELRIELDDWARLPQLNAIARYTHSEGNHMQATDSAFVGAVLQWTVWDWGARNDRLAIAQLERQQAALRTEGLSQDLRLQVEQLYLSFQTSRSSARAAELAAQAAEESARAARLQFEIGELDSSHVLDAEARLLLARGNCTRARAEALLALAALRLALGEPYEATLSSAEISGSVED